RPQRTVLPGRLRAIPGAAALVADRRADAAEGRPDRRGVHAHGLGAPVPDLRDPRASAVPAGARRTDGGRSRAYLRDAAAVLPLTRVLRRCGADGRRHASCVGIVRTDAAQRGPVAGAWLRPSPSARG